MGRIFVQYIVDMYVKIENTRLDYMRHNQTTLRSELYRGIVDSVNDGNHNASEIGRRVILPASYIGGPRDMKCRYLNAMALVQHYGKPDIFLTMTCNPNWPELKYQLLPSERADNRPDLVARIFNSKVRMLRKLLMEDKIFGKIAARVDVIEFQKRGLPHLHMLIILAPESKISTPECFDKYVSAELPPIENGYLRTLVERHMMHGPCGELNPNCPCMKKVGVVLKCKCQYPKKFAEWTSSTEDSYPIYRRRNNGDFVMVKHKPLDNRWVAPYNPFLLATFDCHLNVEICSTIQAVKYLYKYVYKGHDKVAIDIRGDESESCNEITSYQSGRWVSGPEAAWRIFEFDLYSMKPAVIPLQLHLPHMHVIRFAANSNLIDIVNNDNRSITMLTAYFTANLVLENAPLILYSEFPQHYTWSPTRKEWTERKASKCIGRLVYASPSEGERYYLRLLLIHVRGSTSFDNLLTYEGVQYSTFKEVAMRRGLLERDDYSEACMADGVAVEMPSALRRLFATLLVFSDQVNALDLWTKFYGPLSEDFAHNYKGQTRKILNLTYSVVATCLEGMDRSMTYYNLQDCMNSSHNEFRLTRDISDAVDAPIPNEYINAHMKLNAEQRAAYDDILFHVTSGLPGAFFIDGPGGTGKTFLYCALYATLRKMEKIILPTASSGIAASNMPTGRTAHSRFKIPIAQHGLVTCNVSKQSALASLLKACCVIIWDEASMANKEDIEALDRMLQDICNSKNLFGGKIIIFGGDFRQVLPVLPRKSQLDVVNACLVNSYLWAQFKRYRLTTNIRTSGDIDFTCFLLRLGNGDLQNDGVAEVILPDCIKCYPIEIDSFDLLTQVMFPELKDANFSSAIFTDRAILTPTNDAVDNINKSLITQFPGLAYTYTSFDSIIDDNCNLYPMEFLNSLCPSGMPPHLLVLKEGCPIILLRNLDPPHGLCNGTRLICRGFRKDVLLCEITVGYNKGVQVLIPRINLRPPENTYPFQFERKQFPVKLCFAMTINKSQGQTLDRISVYLTQPCFAPGQLYVALSRARMSSKVAVFVPSMNNGAVNKTSVTNVVSFDVLRRAGILPPSACNADPKY